MEITNINPSRKKVLVQVEDVKPGDLVYLSSKDDAQAYSVLDVGKPFILIENLKSHFCNLYRPINLYKEE